MKLVIIVAIDLEGGIGKNNDLLWHLPSDMRFFKETTSGHIVVHGRKSYESIPEKYRPLPNRENVVLTRNSAYIAPNCKIFSSLELCLDFYKDEELRTVFIIGGGEVYRQALQSNLVDEMYITHVNHVYEADTFFPSFNEDEWDKTIVLTQEVDAKHAVSFVTYLYKRID